ncbi:MAG: hypothetical protein NTZ17_02220 [Phycisphaerae bacterium]|nr:hypothetical protein [Phycisphaerae bacterium]
MLAVVLLAILAALWLIWGPVGPVLYLAGLFNSLWACIFALLAVLLLALSAVVSVPVLPVLLGYTLITWRRQSPRARLSLLLGTAAVGGLVVPFVISFTGLTPRPLDMFARGVARYVKTHADIEGIQAWLGTFDPNEFRSRDMILEREFANAEQPAAMAALKANWATVRSDDKGHLTVRLQLCGSGLMWHWGIAVGGKDMPTPPSDFSDFGEQRFFLAPGAYIWLTTD